MFSLCNAGFLPLLALNAGEARGALGEHAPPPNARGGLGSAALDEGEPLVGVVYREQVSVVIDDG
jgi:hypothetical protein